MRSLPIVSLASLLSIPLLACATEDGDVTVTPSSAAVEATVPEVGFGGTAETVIGWNAIALQLEPADFAFPATRMGAMLHVAMHDAINSVDPRYETWGPRHQAGRGGSAPAAAVQAAFEIASRLVPLTHRPPTTTYANGSPTLPFGKDLLQARINERYTADMAAIPDGTAKRKGIEIGRRAAEFVWNARAHDNAETQSPSPFDAGAPKSPTFLATWWRPYVEQQQPIPDGTWRMHPGDFGSPPTRVVYPATVPLYYWWDTVTPWGFGDATPFLAPPPPAPVIDPTADCTIAPLERFTCQLEKTRRLGEATSSARTPDQEAAARWWGACPDAGAAGSFLVAQELVRRHRQSLVDAARVFALSAMSAADAMVVQKINKNRWAYPRPITSIRALRQPDWTPLLATPPDQEYAAGHATTSGAVLGTLQEIFGGGSFASPMSLASHSQDPRCVGSLGRPPKRIFASLDDAVDDVVMARVYGGMHYENSGRVGARIGRALAMREVAKNLRPLK